MVLTARSLPVGPLGDTWGNSQCSGRGSGGGDGKESDYEGRPTGELAAMLIEARGVQRVLIRRELADRSFQGGDMDGAVDHLSAAGEEALTLDEQATAGEVFIRLGAARFDTKAWEESVCAYRRSAECFAAAGSTW